MIARAMIFLISVYRLVKTSFIGDCCRFEPSCSLYGIMAIRQYGACKGGWLTLKRLMRCHPFAPGGVDPVPSINLETRSS